MPRSNPSNPRSCYCFHSMDVSASVEMKDPHFEIYKCQFKKTDGDLEICPSAHVKLRRRHSDPGPKSVKFVENQSDVECDGDCVIEVQNCCNEEIPTIQYEIEKDEALCNLLQEIRNLRQINRKLSVELFHSKMLLQIAEQTNHYSSEPGSASALVRKLIDTHNAKYDYRTPSSRETLGRFGNVSPKTSSEAEDPNCLQKEYEELKHRLRTVESKLKEIPNFQRGGPHQLKCRDSNGFVENLASADRLLPNLVSSSLSTLTSIEDMDSVISLNGLDSEAGRPNWTAANWPRIPAFHLPPRLNTRNVDAPPDNLSYPFPVGTNTTRIGLEGANSIESAPYDTRCNIKQHFRSNHDSLV